MGSHWTDAEDAILRNYRENSKRSAAIAWATLEPRLPGRTRTAIRGRLTRLGLRKLRPWTPREDETLRLEWGVVGQRSLMVKLPKRTWVAIWQRARKLDLGPCTQGRLSIHAAAEKSGLDKDLLRRLIDAAGVNVRDYPAPRYSTATRRVQLVEWDDVEPVVIAWLSAEGPSDAATRLRLCCANTLRRRAKLAGLIQPHMLIRLAPETWDRLARAR